MDTLTFVISLFKLLSVYILSLLLYAANRGLFFATYDLFRQENRKTVYIASVAALWGVTIGAWCLLFAVCCLRIMFQPII